jgi:sulfate adenylyltransferase subunit 1
VPVSALEGDNVATPSERTPWYSGPTLLEHLESVPVAPDPHDSAFRFPVQYVIRPRTAEYPDYRGYAGQIAAGTVRPGDEIVVLPQGLRSKVERIDTADGPLEEAGAGTSVTLLLADELDIARGDLIAAADRQPEISDEIVATLCWLSAKPLKPGAKVLVKHGARTVQAFVEQLHARFDEQSLSSVDDPDELALNDIGQVTLRLAEAIGVDDYGTSPRTGAFLVIEPKDGDTLAAGMVGERFK